MFIGWRLRACSDFLLHGSGPTFDDVLGVRACIFGFESEVRLSGMLEGVLERAPKGLSNLGEGPLNQILSESGSTRCGSSSRVRGCVPVKMDPSMVC